MIVHLYRSEEADKSIEMKYIRKVILSLCLSGIVYLAVGQQDTSGYMHLDLAAVTIMDSLTERCGEEKVILPGSHQSGTLSKLLTEQSTAYIKSYGLGSSATISLRGGNAAQTQLQWAGIPINNPMLGQKDISLIPSTLFSDMTLRSGGSSCASGSGAICGVVNLQDGGIDRVGWSGGVQLGYGSFGQRSFSAELSQLSDNGLGFAIRPYFQSADNDFIYKLGTQERTQENAEYDNQGLLINLSKEWTRTKLAAAYWYQETERNLPPTTTQNFSSASQYDLLHRFRMSFTRVGELGKLESSLGLFFEDNDYEDPDRLEVGQNSFRKIYWMSSGELDLMAGLFQFKIETTHVEGQSLSYAEDQETFSQLALYSSYEKALGSFDLEIGLRQEWNIFSDPPIIPSFKISKKYKQHHFHFLFSREYRVPTLNELFWVPGGNAELESELGWSSELGYDGELGEWQFSLSLYDRAMDNWILWIPQQASIIWSPINVAEVTSRGWATGVIKTWAGKKYSLQASADYGFAYSVYETAVPAQSIAVGDQLLYTPRHRAVAGVSLDYAGLQLAWNSNYTSSVEGVNEDLDDYFISGMSLGYGTEICKEVKAKIIFAVENIFDKQYRVIERRPMPGRYLNMQMNLNF